MVVCESGVLMVMRDADVTADSPGPEPGDEVRDRAVCVVLSGTGSDGILGVRAFKERHGLVMVQDPSTADYDGMPKNAVASGLADYILAMEDATGASGEDR